MSFAISILVLVRTSIYISLSLAVLVCSDTSKEYKRQGKILVAYFCTERTYYKHQSTVQRPTINAATSD
jgi:hypothetical protein